LLFVNFESLELRGTRDRYLLFENEELLFQEETPDFHAAGMKRVEDNI
jgi:hypothetical protein